MYVIFASGRVKPEFVQPFIESMLDDARGSVRDEPGCQRFDVVQDKDDPTRICLFEIYRDKAAFEAHLVAPHFLRWKETVKDWYVEPMAGYHCNPLFLTEEIQHPTNGG